MVFLNNLGKFHIIRYQMKEAVNLISSKLSSLGIEFNIQFSTDVELAGMGKKRYFVYLGRGKNISIKFFFCFQLLWFPLEQKFAAHCLHLLHQLIPL